MTEISFDERRKTRLANQEKNKRENLIVLRNANIPFKEVRSGWYKIFSFSYSYVEFNPSTYEFNWTTMTGKKHIKAVNVMEQLAVLGCA